MAASKFSISVVIGAVDKFTATLQKVQKRTDALTKPIRKIGTDIAKVGTYATAAVGLIGAATYKMLDSFTATGDEVAKLARQVGLGAEALQEWRHASEIAGVGGDNFDRAVNQLNRRLGEMRTGVGKTATYMKEVAPEVFKQFKNAKDTDDALGIAIRAMQRIEDPAKRAAFASKLFGEELGAKMTRFAEMGAKGIEEARKEARLYGVISEDAAKQSEAWRDNMTRLQRSIMGVVYELGSRLLPVLQPYINRLRDWIVANKDLIAQRIEQVVGKVASALESLGAWLGENGPGMWESFKDAVSTISDLVDKVGGAGNAIKILAGTYLIGSLAPALAQIITAAGGAGAALTAAFSVAAIAVFLKGVTDLIDAMDQLGKFQAWKEEQDALAKRTADIIGDAPEEYRRRKEQGLPITQKDKEFYESVMAENQSSNLSSFFAPFLVSMPEGHVTVSVLLGGNVPEGTKATTETKGRGVKPAGTRFATQERFR